MRYGRLIDEICRDLGLSVAFLCADGTSVFFDAGISSAFPTAALAADFDAARMRWLRDWKPDLVLVIDRWDERWSAAAPAGFNRQVRDLVESLETHAGHIIFFSQVPVLRLGQDVNLREVVVSRLRTEGALPRIAPDFNEGVRRITSTSIESVARDHPKVQLLRLDRAFYADDGSVRYVSGRSFLYADDDHLSEAGAQSVQESCWQAVAAAFGR
jgi:SGNH domain (fused to AT3 domains)